MYVIVERGISLGYTLEFIVEVYHYLTEWKIEKYFHTIARYIVLLHQFATLAEA